MVFSFISKMASMCLFLKYVLYGETVMFNENYSTAASTSESFGDFSKTDSLKECV